MGRIVIELTDRCELHCRHCLVRPRDGGHDLDMRLFEKLLAEARRARFEFLSFSGGEPALHPEFARIVRLADRVGYRFGVMSNGWDFPAVLSHLERCRGRLEGITFSLDGATPAVHDWLRGKGSFRRLMQAISLCVVTGLPFTVNTAITRRNRAELQAIAELAAQLGSRGVRFGHLIPTPETAFWDLDLSPEERKLVDAEIRGWSWRGGIPIALAPGYYTTDLFPCAVLRGEEVSLNCRGQLRWCCQLPAANHTIEFGNLDDCSFAELLRGLAHRQEQFRQAKRARFESGGFLDSDLFPCGYCARCVR